MTWFCCIVLKDFHLLLSLALLPLVADHWSCPISYSKNTGKIQYWNSEHGYLKEESNWARRRYDFIKRYASLTQKQKYAPCFFEVHMDSANCCEAVGIFKYTYQGEFAKIPKELGRTLKRCWQLSRLQCIKCIGKIPPNLLYSNRAIISIVTSSKDSISMKSKGGTFKNLLLLLYTCLSS